MVKKFLNRKGSFNIFIKLYDQIEQIFNTTGKFMRNPNPMEIIFDIRRSEVTKS